MLCETVGTHHVVTGIQNDYKFPGSAVYLYHVRHLCVFGGVAEIEFTVIPVLVRKVGKIYGKPFRSDGGTLSGDIGKHYLLSLIIHGLNGKALRNLACREGKG